jgi:hypothetical protein
MTYKRKILAKLEGAKVQAAALESLAHGMAAGLREGTVDGDHLCTLLATQAEAILAQLAAAEAAVYAPAE